VVPDLGSPAIDIEARPGPRPRPSGHRASFEWGYPHPPPRQTTAYAVGMRLELTKKGDYAVRAMLALARDPGDRPVSARRIADAMDIPVRFLPQVLGDLQRAGLVEATAGRSGGYRLAADPGAISLLAVIEAVEGGSRRRTCVLRGGPCGADGYCDVHAAFFAAQEALLGELARASLADLVAHPAALQAG
jgi:Rrf2 family transcriptional regulator, iron-sulfur cluster assembly transcription factor